MIITKKHLLNKVRDVLRDKFPNDLILSIRSLSADYVVFRLKHDELYKVIFESDGIELSSIKNFVKHSPYWRSLIRKKYYVVYVTNDSNFKFIQIN